MKINVSTHVESNMEQVWAQFDESLFKALNPPFPPVKLLRFDGSQKGDEVHLLLNFLLFKQLWKSLITDQGEKDGEIYFVDEGIQLPFFLKKWRHRHRIVRNGRGSTIIDEIEYHTPLPLLDWLMYPAMIGQFLYRKPVYQKFFAKKKSAKMG